MAASKDSGQATLCLCQLCSLNAWTGVFFCRTQTNWRCSSSDGGSAEECFCLSQVVLAPKCRRQLLPKDSEKILAAWKVTDEETLCTCEAA